METECFEDTLSQQQLHIFYLQMYDEDKLCEFLVEHGMDSGPASGIEAAMNNNMIGIIHMTNRDIMDQLWESGIIVERVFRDQFMQIVYFTRAVLFLSHVDKQEEMTAFWMDIGVTHHNAGQIAYALSMEPDDLQGTSDAEIQALLSANQRFVQTSWIMDWVVALMHRRDPERLLRHTRQAITARKRIDKEDWFCHAIQHGHIVECDEDNWYCHETQHGLMVQGAAPADADPSVASRPTANAFLV